MDKITGKLTGFAELSGTLSASGSLSGAIGVPDQVPVDPYPGPYSVIPSLDGVILLTEGYRMTEDVTVQRIPVVATSNIYGGKTVVIG